MGKGLFRRGLNAPQQQTLVLSISAFFTATLLLGMISIVLLIFARGGGYFWPEDLYRLELITPGSATPTPAYGEYHGPFQQNDETRHWVVYSHQQNPYGERVLITTAELNQARLAKNAARVLLQDGRTILGRPEVIKKAGTEAQPLTRLADYQQQVESLSQQIKQIRDGHLAELHRQIRDMAAAGSTASQRTLDAKRRAFEHWQGKIRQLETARDKYTITVVLADNSQIQIPLSQIEQLIYPGQLHAGTKLLVALDKVWRFLTEAPKQANTAGGIFPALFGTVLMVFLMTLIVTPFGVLAAVYLHEYAPQNALTTTIRIAVTNMAGVPSIVYGVFGLGFFIYGVGGQLDSWFFADALPAPTLGTPGVFWAALTMAILTLPVVIVATEEGLRNVPADIKAGSYALGATKAETMIHTVLPMASPGIMTGVILAIARAAGEVAPLMLVGAVKFAPNLPIDGEFPFLHLERQFMHLGVLIYDGAFHSQVDTSGASMMFAACLLLLVVVFVLNIIAVVLRNRLRQRYQKGG
ncbi:phosphate ABC transporter permease PstA [Salinimonas marina]|uniref:Phosphate transport system permease protein PstA n=1 Tax=Salinimonas marina TaxID=2785918 RepID=A0A7S9DW91_9ALTE|nr:phosphate ABC transporter permease PstA [Salinimonas marina]QPG05111.1 phosphate ABC transporter permease PstA [Salinimonas marina]